MALTSRHQLASRDQYPGTLILGIERCRPLGKFLLTQARYVRTINYMFMTDLPRAIANHRRMIEEISAQMACYVTMHAPLKLRHSLNYFSLSRRP